MRDTFLLILAIGSAVALLLPWNLVWHAYKNLRDTWTGKSKNIRRDT